MENPLLLHIETATEICSVALTLGNNVIGTRETNDGNSHSKNLLPFIDQVLKESHHTMNDLQGVVVSIGPGSYTGLRIGVSMAKGIAYSLGIPIITVSTLNSIAQGACHAMENPSNCIFVPMIDARRMEVFATQYDALMNPMKEVEAIIVDQESFKNLLENNIVVFCGNGMPKCKELLATSENARFCDAAISAGNMLPTALRKWAAQDFADVAYFEPFYLKDYVAAKPNVKGLH